MGLNELTGQQVQGVCSECGREPQSGETYGPHRFGWDFLNICPECWDDMFEEREVAETDDNVCA